MLSACSPGSVQEEVSTRDTTSANTVVPPSTKISTPNLEQLFKTDHEELPKLPETEQARILSEAVTPLVTTLRECIQKGKLTRSISKAKREAKVECGSTVCTLKEENSNKVDHQGLYEEKRTEEIKCTTPESTVAITTDEIEEQQTVLDGANGRFHSLGYVFRRNKTTLRASKHSTSEVALISLNTAEKGEFWEEARDKNKLQDSETHSFGKGNKPKIRSIFDKALENLKGTFVKF